MKNLRKPSIKAKLIKSSAEPYGFSIFLDGFFGDKDSIYNAILPRARCYAGSSQWSLNYRSLGNYSSAVVIHVSWVPYHSENFNFLSFSSGVGNVCVVYTEQPNFFVSSTSSVNLPFEFTQRCLRGERTPLISSLASVPSFSTTRRLPLVFVSVPY